MGTVPLDDYFNPPADHLGPYHEMTRSGMGRPGYFLNLWSGKIDGLQLHRQISAAHKKYEAV